MKTMFSTLGLGHSINSAAIRCPSGIWNSNTNYWEIHVYKYESPTGVIYDTKYEFVDSAFKSYSTDTVLEPGWYVMGCYDDDGASEMNAILSSVESQTSSMYTIWKYTVKDPSYGLAMGGYIRASTSRYHIRVFYTGGDGTVPYRAQKSTSEYVTLWYQKWAM
jgi:hypothetical protein